MNDLTEGRRIYAVGDVHGRSDLLGEMLARIRSDLKARPHGAPLAVMLGDYVDRGPDSRGVLEMLIGLAEGDLPSVFLLGNHDACALEFLEDPDTDDRPLYWLDPTMGGAATLESYGIPRSELLHPDRARVEFAAAIPADHRAFLEACRLMHRVGGYVFAHAGIRPGVPLEDQSADDLVWIREPFLTSTRDFGFKVVHGHTIVPEVQHHPNRIAVDTGAVRSGLLSCVVLEGDDVALLETDGPEQLPVGSGGGLGRLRTGLRGLWPRR